MVWPLLLSITHKLRKAVSYMYTLLTVSVWFIAKFGTCTCTVVSVNGILVEAKLWTFTLECTFVQVPHLYHDDASDKFSTNLHETDYCVVHNCRHVGASTEYVHCHIIVATPLSLFGIRSRPLLSTLKNLRGKSAGFFSLHYNDRKSQKFAKYFLQSPVH
jgi:hypothetical protein